MISRTSVSFWLLRAALILSCVSLIGISGPAAEEAASREQQIADLERQIQELTKKLNELKRQSSPAAPAPAIPTDWTRTLSWRSIGPASMGGRIVAISVYEAEPNIYWIATASGGLLKTTNNGITFEHQFDHEATVSLGDVCVAPSNKNIVWVGTGENNPRNSVSYGDGVNKSTDGGKTWKNMGLKKTFQIGRIIVHPKNPDIVYVGALGRLYGPNEERGLFKTTDGGKTWKKILYVDDKTGVIDMRMHPTEPETLLAATWERMRDGFDSHRGEPPLQDGYDVYDPIKKWGPGGAIYKTTDGGKTFRKLTKGLPTCRLGRIGLDYSRKNPSVVFALIDCEKIGMGTPPSQVYLGVAGENGMGGAKLTQISADSPAAKAGLKVGDIVKAVDKKPIGKYEELAQQIRGHKIGDKLTLTIQRDKETRDVVVTLGKRPAAPGSGGRQRLPVDFRGEDTPNGVRVERVLPGGMSEKAGLKAGDIIQQIDKTAVKSFRQAVELFRAHNPGDKVTVKVLRGKDSKDLSLTVARPATPGQASSKRPYSFWYGGQRENVQDQQGPNSFEYGGLYKSIDGGESWTRINSVNPRPMYFSQVRVDPSDEKYIYVLGIGLYRSENGGKTFKTDGGEYHPDQHALWIDPRDGRHMLLGTDGGYYVTYDRMARWEYLNNMAIGQYYHVSLDSRLPYRTYGGLQDNGCWGGPSHTLDGQGPINADWVLVNGGDGFVCRVDPQDSDLVYCESQDGHMARRNLRTGEFAPIRPRDVKGQPPYRFNWNTPFLLSSHNSQIFYCGGNYVFRSVKKGDDLQAISREISRSKRGTASALAESPRSANVLYAGTDDGYLWVTRDGGVKWTNVADKVGLPGPRWVASIEPSRFADGRAYVVFDAHRSDDDAPYVYVTENFGQTWKSLHGNLPIGSTRVLREDIENQNVLYLGTEFGVWVSINRGGVWTKINNNLPTVAIHELAQHPTSGEMVAATHGRSLWIVNVTPLRQMKPESLKAEATLFKPPTAMRWRREPTRGTPYGAGNHRFVGENPPSGAQIYYSLCKKAEKVQLKIVDYTGQTLRELPVKKEQMTAGLHRLTWDLARSAGPRRGRGRSPAPPGMYRIVLTVDGKEHTQGLRVENDPLLKSSNIIAEEEEDEEEREKRGGRIDD
ncbi:MAG TPA: PDZ domain-containing protein [Gemmataceae bacterium]|nr:PDZ domain-containing protein [Gemmataceae bacterium]